MTPVCFLLSIYTYKFSPFLYLLILYFCNPEKAAQTQPEKQERKSDNKACNISHIYFNKLSIGCAYNGPLCDGQACLDVT